MKVNIKHREIKKGLIFKTTFYSVELTVTFSEEEKAIIEKFELQSDMLLERGVPADRNSNSFDGLEDVFNLTIHKLMSGTDEYAFATLGEAKRYETIVTEKLPVLKDHIMDHGSASTEDVDIEL